MSPLVSQLTAALAPTYEVQRELGRGGMATVYLARERKHDRLVAIKVLSPALSASIAHERFLREIRVAARLAHPHILPLLDSGEAAGLPYYVMPFVEGESLRERLTRETRLPPEVALGIVAEVGDALHYAHAAGIVHRDVKPDNVMMLGEHAVVVDFGVARAMASANEEAGEGTSIGLAVGTPAYMSPEQAAAEDELDGRSDEYALAIMLFEMLTGEPPFVGATSRAVIAQRFAGPAPRLRDRLADAPEVFDESIARALSLETADRFDSVASFVRALRGVQTDTWTPSATPRAETAGASVAVLPFTNLSGDADSEYFSDGVTEEIMIALGRLRNLRVAARSSSFAFKGRGEDARRIGAALGVRSVLEGSVRRAGNRVRVTSQLVEASTGFQLWADRFDRELVDVFAIQEDIAHAIAGVLDVRLLGQEVASLATVSAVREKAHDAYLRGRFALNSRTEGGLREALAQFEASEAEDPSYAAAHAAEGEALLLLALYGAEAPGGALLRARDAAERATSIDPVLADAYVVRASVASLHDRDWPAAEELFRRAIALSPRAPTPRQRYAMDCLVPQRRFGEALRQIDEACLLDPLAPILEASRAVVRHLAGDAAGAASLLAALTAREPGFAIAHYFLGSARRDAGDVDGAIDAYGRAIELTGGTPEMLAAGAQAFVLAGRESDARELLAELEASARQRYVSPALMAQVQIALGNRDAALALLDEAIAAHDPELALLPLRPAYASLLGDERFRRLRDTIDPRKTGVFTAS